MNSDSNFETLVTELKADLPNERDSARLRTRLAALGIAAAQGVAGSAAAAMAGSGVAGSATAGSATAAATTGLAQAGVSALAIKTFAIALVAGAGVTGSAWYVQRERSDAEPATHVAADASRISPWNAGSAAPRTPPAIDVREPGEHSDLAERKAPNAAPEAATPKPASRAEARVAAPNRLPTPLAADMPPPAPVSTVATPVAANGFPSTAAFAEPASAPPSAPTPVASETVAPRSSAAPPSGVEATTLRAETALLDRALTALRASDIARAERLLSQHRTRYPDGLLKRERERAERKLAELKSGQSGRNE